jgi:hypothetical protein
VLREDASDANWLAIARLGITVRPALHAMKLCVEVQENSRAAALIVERVSEPEARSGFEGGPDRDGAPAAFDHQARQEREDPSSFELPDRVVLEQAAPTHVERERDRSELDAPVLRDVLEA